MDRHWRILDELEQCSGDPVGIEHIVKFLTPEELHFVKTYGTPELVGKLRNPLEKPVAIAGAKKQYRINMKGWKDEAEFYGLSGEKLKQFLNEMEAKERATLAAKLKKIEEDYK